MCYTQLKSIFALFMKYNNWKWSSASKKWIFAVTFINEFPTMKSAVCVLFLTGLKKVKRRKKANSAKKISVCQQIFNILVTWVGIQTKDSIWKMLTQNWNNFSPKLVSPSLLTYSLHDFPFVSFTKISSNEMNQFHGIFELS